MVAALAARMEPTDTLEEEACVTDALKFGRQAYLQRRISSESSIGKLLFKNGFKMLQSRQLTEGGSADMSPTNAWNWPVNYATCCGGWT